MLNPDGVLASPLKWHGGKGVICKRIVAMMPPHLHYVEPYAGGLSVLLAKNPEGVSEVVNDIDGDLAHFWRVLADEQAFAVFARIVQATPFSQEHWDLSHYAPLRRHPAYLSPEAAAGFMIHVRQSMAGRRENFAPMSKTRLRQGMNEQAAAWMSAVDGLAEVHARLRRVVILNRPAVEVIASQDGADTLQYLDPPYLHETRSVPKVYRHEMSDADHAALLDAITACKGKVMISGYPSAMYDDRLKTWHRVNWDVPNKASHSKVKKRRMTEVVWMNFDPPAEGSADAV